METSADGSHSAYASTNVNAGSRTANRLTRALSHAPSRGHQRTSSSNGVSPQRSQCARQGSNASTTTEDGLQNRARRHTQRSKRTQPSSLKRRRPIYLALNACSVPNHRLSFAGDKPPFQSQVMGERIDSSFEQGTRIQTFPHEKQPTPQRELPTYTGHN